MLLTLINRIYGTIQSGHFAAICCIDDDEESDQNGDQLPANDDDGKQPSTVLSEPNVIKSKRMVSDDNGFVTDKCRPTTKGNRRTNIASEVCETGDKAAFTKRRSQSPNMLFDHESDGSGDVEDMDLEDLVTNAAQSKEKAKELLRQRRCMSDSEILRHTTASRPVERAHSASPYKYRRPDPIICDESIEIDCLMRRAHFFLARSCRENIRLAKERSFWTTSPRIEQTLGESFMKASAVILVFIEKGADHFAGFAKMCSKALYRGQPALCWKEFNGGGNIKLQWISRCTLPITATKHLKNSLNHGKAVYAGVDGSKIQRTTGQQLCSLFPIDESIDLSTLRVTRGKKRVHRRGYSSKRRRKSELPNLTAEERWENDALNFMYSSSFSYKGHSTHKMSFEDALQYELYRPMPLMDLAVDYPLSTSSSSRRKSHSRSERDREWRDRDRDRMHRISPSRRHSPVLNAHLHRLFLPESLLDCLRFNIIAWDAMGQ
uniref:YTH domain-containing protein n=1 Tax=Toxocara canis TaxID=6265 RepID=A0A183V167_TOXCA